MAFRVVVSPRARIKLLEIATWWGEHRSGEQAALWLDGWRQVWQKLSESPDGFPLIPEHEHLGIDARHFLYWLGRKKTHRAVFTVFENTVIVHTIRHLAQDDLKSSDIGM